jgi:hypothetical protein
LDERRRLDERRVDERRRLDERRLESLLRVDSLRRAMAFLWVLQID